MNHYIHYSLLLYTGDSKVSGILTSTVYEKIDFELSDLFMFFDDNYALTQIRSNSFLQTFYLTIHRK